MFICYAYRNITKQHKICAAVRGLYRKTVNAMIFLQLGKLKLKQKFFKETNNT